MKDQNYINILKEELSLKDMNPKTTQELVSKAIEVSLKKSEYEKKHPEVKTYENSKEARDQYFEEKIRERFKNLEPFNGNPDKIPEIPVMPPWFLKTYVWPELIKAGAISKEKLIPGKEYIGSCRNTDKATWDGEKFTYTRYKFGDSWEESINHFQDDDGSDIFIPIHEKS